VEMDTRRVYAVGCGLGLVGSLAAAVGLTLAGSAATGVLTLGSTVVIGLVMLAVGVGSILVF